MSGKIIVRDNLAKDSTYSGLIAHEDARGRFTMNDVLIQNLVVDGAGTNGIDVTPEVKGSATVDNVIVRGDRMKMVSNPASGFRFNEVNQGFASLKKPPVDPEGPENPGNPSNPSNPGGNGGSSGGSSGTGSPSGASPTAPPTTSSDEALNNGIKEGKAKIELQADASGNVTVSANVLAAAAKAHPETVIVISSNEGVYQFPLHLTSQVLKQAGVADESKAVISFHITALTETEQNSLAQQAVKQGIQLAGTAAKFTVQVTEGSKSSNIDQFEGATYVERTLTVKGKLDPKTTVALLYDPASGTLKYVPALFEVNADGTTTVIIKSPANGIFTVATNAKTFTDIVNHWAKTDIEKLASRYIVTGKSGDHFDPAQPVSRAEFTAMLIRALGLQSSNQAQLYEDVPSNAWYNEAISTAAHYKLVQGYQGNNFRPDGKITRQEMAAMIARAMALLNVEVNENGAKLTAYKDGAQVQGWASEYVELLLNAGIMKGQSSTHFAPNSPTTRAEAAVILLRLLQAGKLINP